MYEGWGIMTGVKVEADIIASIAACPIWRAVIDTLTVIIWGRCSRRTVIFLTVYKISSLKITPSKTPNSGQFLYPLPNIVSFLFRLEFRFRSHDFSLNLFPVWQPYCWRFWSAIVPIHTSTINAPELWEHTSDIYIYMSKPSNLTLLFLSVTSQCVWRHNDWYFSVSGSIC